MKVRSSSVPEVVEVQLPAVDPERFAAVLTADQMAALRASIDTARGVFAGRTAWSVNSTAKGGGVAEMLTSLVPYARGAGVDTRWLVIDGDEQFFRITKRIHNRLHGSPGDGEGLGDDDRRHYEAVLAGQAVQLTERIHGGDVVILHDPQTAGLVPLLADAGCCVVWRCHVGIDTPNQEARETWGFLLPYVRRAARCVFSRKGFAWEGLDADRIRVVAPSIDPFSAKNYDMDGSSVAAILGSAGIASGDGAAGATYVRVDGSPGRVEHQATMVEVAAVPEHAPLLVQISRWDRLKDHAGVLQGFANGVAPRCDAHLILAGPSVAEVADDPEGQEVYAEIRRAVAALPDPVRSRVHLACLPMEDEQENAAMVNALQRRATVVVQKSLAEGFGLTVAEAMWKGRPVVASRIGGIQDQIEDGVSGVLLADPTDHAEFAQAVCELLLDPRRARDMGEAARRRVQEQFLGSRDLAQYVAICAELV